MFGMKFNVRSGLTSLSMEQIGDFMCQVSRHPWPEDIACILCLFQQPVGRPTEEVQSEVTGLSKLRLQNPDTVVTNEDVEAAAPEKKDFLKSFVGH